jgi:uncharacterized membrane protein YfcA
MGLFDDGIFDAFGGIFEGLGSTLFGGLFGGGGGATVVPASSFAYPVPSFPVGPPVAPPMPEAIPTAAPAVRALTTIPRWAQSYPRIWQFIQRARASGRAVTLQSLLSLLRRFGPTALTAILGAELVADLVTLSATRAGRRRRMNPANVRALRRSVRRLQSFDRLSARVSAQLGRVASRRRGPRRGRCMTCRANPCRCN